MKRKDKFKESLFKLYNDKLEALYRRSFANASIDLKFFIAYLKYLRDYYIIKGTEASSEDQTIAKKIIFFTGAIVEYERYEDCIHDYYDIKDNLILPKNGNGSEETLVAYNTEKTLHWNAFWEIIRLNIEDWREDGTTI